MSRCAKSLRRRLRWVESSVKNFAVGNMYRNAKPRLTTKCQNSTASYPVLILEILTQKLPLVPSTVFRGIWEIVPTVEGPWREWRTSAGEQAKKLIRWLRIGQSATKLIGCSNNSWLAALLIRYPKEPVGIAVCFVNFLFGYTNVESTWCPSKIMRADSKGFFPLDIWSIMWAISKCRVSVTNSASSSRTSTHSSLLLKWCR